jgi:hypothetical protein
MAHDFNINNPDNMPGMPDEMRREGAEIARQLITIERERLVHLLAMDLDEGHSWDETLVRGLVATQVFVGSLMTALRVAYQFGDMAEDEINKARLAAITLLESTGGVGESVDIVLGNLRAHEGGVRK